MNPAEKSTYWLAMYAEDPTRFVQQIYFFLMATTCIYMYTHKRQVKKLLLTMFLTYNISIIMYIVYICDASSLHEIMIHAPPPLPSPLPSPPPVYGHYIYMYKHNRDSWRYNAALHLHTPTPYLCHLHGAHANYSTQASRKVIICSNMHYAIMKGMHDAH